MHHWLMSKWGSRLLTCAIAAQIAVPTTALVMAPHHYGFQMFSGLEWVNVTVHDDTGELIPVEPPAYTARFRGDVDWTQRLPELLCEEVDAAVTVTVERHRGTRSLECD
jgi:hypothetical protein